ncbi:MAG: nucleoside deaminase [Tenuifilum sp.]|jgi:tRNA(adenine34) deaminase|uniref:nucleoside deaminase n=1 Tax=Tenuifilum sp. TaxID=2760880 RepID=UPI000A4DD0A2|nr:nucleoside deaminase [Bacteroidales bacterium]HOK87141.1 nucleoside deaminase [Tenuifilum sp.]HOU75363.1 nucleoside deaminase [Tenuifilum sp.]HQE55519.1 nucleoside deaminase [Tenuifilum sp.]HQG73614.1 nucleoside deaminase [Tenuifilum sp.]
MENTKDHEFFMREALKEAQKALAKDEVPIGAVVVCNGRIVSRAYNLTETLGDPTAHAEMQAITAATNYLGGKYLNQCTLYVTIEPCPMCAGALYWAQVGQLVYGAPDPKRGFSLIAKNILHPKTKTISGVLANECSNMITTFFNKKR